MKDQRLFALVAIDAAQKRCTRYYGRIATHVFEVESEITAGKVENIRMQPAETGVSVTEPRSA